MLLTHAFALSASQSLHKEKSLRIYASMRSVELELTKLTYSRHDDNLLHTTTGATDISANNIRQRIRQVRYAREPPLDGREPT